MPDVEITANIWDFGGQEIQYMLHQYFLSRDALYVVVSDGRSETSKFGYWFLMIEMLGTASSRIVVLVNRFKDATGINPFARVQYRRDFPALNTADDELDLSETNESWWNFRKLIAESLAKLPIIGQKNIKVWNTIRRKIEQTTEPYISTKEFYKMARIEGMDSDSDIEQMLDYFNRIGVVIYFSEDPYLANTVFLNPNWITEAIYMVLSNKNIDYKKGTFKRQWLFDFWQAKGYKNYECADLLNLMQKNKFDICYPLSNDNEQFMVPSILRNDMPENVFEYKDMLQLRYTYEGFMPFGIISRLIVRLYQFIHNQLIWQRGAILIFENAAKAEIVHPFGKNEIQIRITGERKKEFRAIIKSELDLIVAQFPYDPEIKVPCICNNCRNSDEPWFYPYLQLFEMRESKVENVQCGKKPYKMVNVVELINGIEFTNFRRLLLDENFEEFFKLMTSKFADISYQTKKEKMLEYDFHDRFHIFLKENGLSAESENSTSDGRIDEIVKIANNLYIFELKLDKTAEEALNQIVEKKYFQKFETEYDKIFLFGVNFDSKTRNIESFKVKKVN